MNREDIIETILREVKRVLAEKGVDVVKDTIPKSGVSEKTQDTRFVSVNFSDSGDVDFTGKKVLAQSDISGLAGKRVTIQRRTVITPLALDYARENKIELIKIENAETKSASSAGGKRPSVAVIFCPNYGGDKEYAKDAIKNMGFTVNDLTCSPYENAVKKVALAVERKEVLFGVCYEKVGLLGPVYANRNNSVIAVHCRDDFEARAARVDYNANIVVIGSGVDPKPIIEGFCGY